MVQVKHTPLKLLIKKRVETRPENSPFYYTFSPIGAACDLGQHFGLVLRHQLCGGEKAPPHHKVPAELVLLFF